MPSLVFTPRFKKRFNKKTPEQRAAIMHCLTLLERDERHPGLNAHRIRGREGVWEAYVNTGDRITYHREDGRFVLRMNCNHNEVLRSP